MRLLQGGHEELFQVYYSDCILPLPEDSALKQNNNKGFGIFHCKVHAIEVAGPFEREHVTADVSADIIITGQTFNVKMYLSIRGNKSLPDLTDLFHLNPR